MISVCSSTFHVYCDVTLSHANIISWLHLASSCTNTLSGITELFLKNYGLTFCPDFWPIGILSISFQKGCYRQICYTHYPFHLPVWLYFSSNIPTFPNDRIQDNRTASRLNSAVVYSIVLVIPYASLLRKSCCMWPWCGHYVTSTCNPTTCMRLSHMWKLSRKVVWNW